MSFINKIKSLFKESDCTKENTICTENTILDKILLCAENIIKRGVIVEDNTSSRNIPSVKIKDEKGNTLHISWFSRMNKVLEVEINEGVVPETYDEEIFNMVQERIYQLRMEHLERVVESVGLWED